MSVVRNPHLRSHPVVTSTLFFIFLSKKCYEWIKLLDSDNTALSYKWKNNGRFWENTRFYYENLNFTKIILSRLTLLRNIQESCDELERWRIRVTMLGAFCGRLSDPRKIFPQSYLNLHSLKDWTFRIREIDTWIGR